MPIALAPATFSPVSSKNRILCNGAVEVYLDDDAAKVKQQCADIPCHDHGYRQLQVVSP